jgi:Tfp pilus assembly protein PilF
MIGASREPGLRDKSVSRRFWPRVLIISLLLGLIGLPLLIVGSLALAEYHLRQAKDNIKERDFAGAREQLDQSLSFRPGSLEVRLYAARTARRDRDYKKAKELLQIYLAKGGIPEAVELEEALSLAQSGQLAHVEKKLWVFVYEKHEDAPFVLEALAQGFMHCGRWAEATECLNRLVDFWPDDYAIYVWRGWVFQSLRLPARAEREYRQAVDLRPDQDDARLRLAEVLVLEQQYEAASKELEILSKKLPLDENVLLHMAKCRAEANQLDEAGVILYRLLARKPQHAAVLRELGYVAMKQEQWTEAEKRLRQSLRLSSRDLFTNYYLQRCLRQLGQDAEAEKVSNLVREIQEDQSRLQELFSKILTTRDSLPLRLEAGRILLRNDQEAEGLGILESVIQEDPNNREANAILADHYDAEGKKEIAKVYRERIKKR